MGVGVDQHWLRLDVEAGEEGRDDLGLEALRKRPPGKGCRLRGRPAGRPRAPDPRPVSIAVRGMKGPVPTDNTRRASSREATTSAHRGMSDLANSHGFSRSMQRLAAPTKAPDLGQGGEKAGRRSPAPRRGHMAEAAAESLAFRRPPGHPAGEVLAGHGQRAAAQVPEIVGQVAVDPKRSWPWCEKSPSRPKGTSRSRK